MKVNNLRELLIPALEADDITRRVSSRLSGSTPNDTSSDDKTDTPKDVNSNQLTQVDNLTTNLRENDPDDTEPSSDEDNTPEDNNPGENEIDSTEVDDDDNESVDDSNIESNDNTSDDNTNQDTYMDKNILRDNMIALYNIISADITKITEYISPIDDATTINVLNKVTSNLRECKTALYNIITKKLSELTYVQLITKYISIKKIYDISIEMIEQHSINNKSIKKPHA